MSLLISVSPSTTLRAAPTSGYGITLQLHIISTPSLTECPSDCEVPHCLSRSPGDSRHNSKAKTIYRDAAHSVERCLACTGFHSQHDTKQVWQYTPEILALGGRRQEGQESVVTLGYTSGSRLAWAT